MPDDWTVARRRAAVSRDRRARARAQPGPRRSIQPDRLQRGLDEPDRRLQSQSELGADVVGARSPAAVGSPSPDARLDQPGSDPPLQLRRLRRDRRDDHAACGVGGAPPAGRFAAAEVRLEDGKNYYFEYRPATAGRLPDAVPPEASRYWAPRPSSARRSRPTGRMSSASKRTPTPSSIAERLPPAKTSAIRTPRRRASPTTSSSTWSAPPRIRRASGFAMRRTSSRTPRSRRGRRARTGRVPTSR